MGTKQEVRKARKTKGEEPTLAFDAAKVFGLGADLEPKPTESLDDIAREADMNQIAGNYRARKGEGGDRSRRYGGIW